MEDLKSIRKRLSIKVLYYGIGLILLSVTAYFGYSGINSAIEVVKQENSELVYSAVYGDSLGFQQFLNLYKATLIPIKTNQYLRDYLLGDYSYSEHISNMLNNVRSIGNLKAAYIMNSEVFVFFQQISLF